VGSCIEATYPEYSFGNDGYPRKHHPLRGYVTSAIRKLWEEKYGLLPPGFDPDHRCKNIRCINLDHIEIVTKAENNARAHRKLTADQVREIRKKLEQGYRKAALAREYGVAYMTITYIERKKTWKDLM
jgi:DNA-binding XRE family transcriptional regulator